MSMNYQELGKKIFAVDELPESNFPQINIMKGYYVKDYYDIYFFWKGLLSQWCNRNMTVDGVNYNCCEQYMMAQKAKLFDDEIHYMQIIKSNNPKEQKRLGRKVNGFDKDIWDRNAKDIVFTGNYAKFKQNDDCRQELLNTGNKIIAEASPYDKIWGIGLTSDDPRAKNKSQWPGKNWLGEVLMEVRKQLKKQ